MFGPEKCSTKSFRFFSTIFFLNLEFFLITVSMQKNHSFRLVLFLARLEQALSTKSAIEVKNLVFRPESHPLEQADPLGENREKVVDFFFVFSKNRDKMSLLTKGHVSGVTLDDLTMFFRKKSPGD